MKIGLVLSNSPTYSETFFKSKIKGLQTSGFDVTLYVQKRQEDFDLCKVVQAPKVHKHNPVLQFFKICFVLLGFMLRFPNRFIKFINLEREAKRSWSQIIKNVYNNEHLLTSDMDWVHFGFATMAIQSEHVAKAINAKMAVSLRGFDIALYPRDYPNCYKILWKHVDKVHVLSNDLLNLAYENGMKQHTLFKKITPAIDIKKFSTTLIRLYDFDKIRFTTIARLHWKKGIIETIQALRLLKNMNIKFEYTVIGSGGEFENIIDVINTLELSDNVKLVGQLEHEEIIDYLNKTDVYLQYSISEGFCNALLEAQSMGLLCIASDAEGLKENILHERTGWIVGKNNPEQLSETILTVINLPIEKKKKISEAAKERVRVHFNLELQKKEFKEFYEH